MHTYARACFTCLSVMSIQTSPCHRETGGEAEAGFQFVHLPPSPLYLPTPSKEKTAQNPFARLEFLKHSFAHKRPIFSDSDLRGSRQGQRGRMQVFGLDPAAA